MRYSKQKEEILKIVLSSNNHPDAKYIYNSIRKKMPNISLGTVYRNLDNLVSEGKIRRIYLDNGNDRFDKTTYNHNHMRCIKCNKVIDVDISLSENNVKIIESKTNFKVVSTNFNICGICSNCLNRKEL